MYTFEMDALYRYLDCSGDCGTRLVRFDPNDTDRQGAAIVATIYCDIRYEPEGCVK